VNIDSAKNAVEFCHVLHCDADGRADLIACPGHELRQYQVTLERTKTSITCTCAEREEGQCPGNTHGKVCYHVLAALMKAVEGTGHLEFFESQETPNILQEGGRRKLEIKSGDGPGRLWAVLFLYRKPKKKIKVQCQPKQEALFEMAPGPYDRESGH
jgi:hypothetical protein